MLAITVGRKYCLTRLCFIFLERSLRGSFLDNLDIVDNYPFMKNCVIKLIRDIRRKYPGIIVVNRGFTIVEDIAPYVDAVLFEDFGTYYDFSKNSTLSGVLTTMCGW